MIYDEYLNDTNFMKCVHCQYIINTVCACARVRVGARAHSFGNGTCQTYEQCDIYTSIKQHSRMFFCFFLPFQSNFTRTCVVSNERLKMVSSLELRTKVKVMNMNSFCL